MKMTADKDFHNALRNDAWMRNILRDLGIDETISVGSRGAGRISKGIDLSSVNAAAGAAIGMDVSWINAAARVAARALCPVRHTLARMVRLTEHLGRLLDVLRTICLERLAGSRSSAEGRDG